MNRDILFKENEFVFSLRAAGVLIHEERILLQKPKNDDYAFIGGHVSAFETSEEALVREFREEIHADIAVDGLMAMGEIFFPWGKRPCHQIGLYYAEVLAWIGADFILIPSYFIVLKRQERRFVHGKSTHS